MNRFVVLSDLHAHPWAAFSTGEGANNSRLKQTLFVLQASLVKAHHLEIPWLFAGDLVHTSGYMLNEVLNSVGKILTQFPDVLKIAVWGNHDARGRRTKLELADTVYPILMRSTPNLHVLHQDNPYYHYNGVTIGGAGYQPSPNFLGLLPGGDIGLYHQTVRGSLTAHGFELQEGIQREVVAEAARVAIVGHVHHPQELPSEEGRAILIPGSPEHHNFGDMGDHGWWILSLPDELTAAPTVEFFPGGSPEFRTVDSSREISGEHYYRVRTVTEGERLPHGATVIAPAPTTIRSRDLLHGAAQVEQVLTAWLKHCPPTEGINVTDCMEIGMRILVEQDPIQLRPARLTRLELRNFCSYEHADLIVQDGIWLVTGHGRDFTSNGAGKTTLVGEALYWLLFGRNTKGMSSDEVIRYNTKECFVNAVFQNNGSILSVTRYRGDHSVLAVVQDGVSWEATSVEAMTKKLNRYLGLTPEIFQNLAYFSQEKLLLFSSATDGERKSVLADLVGLTSYQNAGSAVSEHVLRFEKDEYTAKTKQELLESEARQLVTKIEEKKLDVKAFEDDRSSDLLEVNLTLVQNEKRKDNPAHTAVRLAHVLHRTEVVQEAFNRSHRTKIHQYTERFRDQLLLQAQDQIKQARSKHDALFSQLPQDVNDQINVRLPKLTELRDKINTDLLDAITVHARLSAEYNQLLGRAHGLKSLMVHTREQLRRVEGDLQGAACYVCGQAIDESHREMCVRAARTAYEGAQKDFESSERLAKESSQRAADAEQLVARLKRDKQALENTIMQVQGFQTQLSRCTTIQQEIETLEKQQLTQVSHAAYQLAGQQVDKEIQERHIRLERTRNRIIRTAAGMNNQWRDEQARLLREKQAIEERINPHTETLITFENRAVELTERIEDAEDEIVRAQRAIKLYKYWVHGFSRQGIQSLLIEEIATWFNAVRSEVFPTLTQGVYDVQFSTVSFTKAGEPREKTEFKVYEHGVEIPYGITSGGQRRRIDLGIMLTLTLAVSRWMNVPGVLGLITLDEVFGFLDDSGAEGLLATLQQIQNHIPVIFAVTHDQHLQSLFPQLITVEQDANGTSRIVSD